MKKTLLLLICLIGVNVFSQSINLYTPDNGITVNGINTSLFWYDVSGETGYVYQVDTVNTFDSPNLQSETIAAFSGSSGVTGVGIGNLAFGTTYYWRVAYLNGTAQSDWSGTRYFLTVAQPNLYSPYNGEAVNGNSLALRWYDISGETGFVYQVDTVNTFDSPNLQSGTIDAYNSNSSLPAVGIGNLSFGTTYYWRVAFLNGNVQSAWSTIQYFSTIGQPGLYLPNDGENVNGNNVALRWYDISGETGFVYQVDTVNTFDSPNLQSGTLDAYNSNSSLPAVGIGNLLLGTTYYWRIAFLSGTAQSAWSATRYFNTVAQASLYAPSNAEALNTITPILQWYDISGESGYVYQVDSVNTFDSADLQTGTLAAFNTTSGFPTVGIGNLNFGTTYYWRIAILNGTAQSAWSETRNFSTVGQPSLYSPVNDETINGIMATLQWYDVAGETGYVYQVDTVTTFDSAALRSGTLDAMNSFGYPAIGIGDLAFGTKYYWRVAIVRGTSQSAWSSVRNFTTVTNPSLALPTNGTVNVGSSVSLYWNNIAGESGFVYQLDTTPTFNSSNLESGTIGAYSSAIGYPGITFNALLPDTTYFWRIAFLNSTSQSSWSDSWVFATGATLGTKDLEKHHFSVYPNPSSDRIFIGGTASKTTFQIDSADGKRISSGIVENNESIDISSFPNGIYFLKLNSEETSEVCKIVKK